MPDVLAVVLVVVKDQVPEAAEECDDDAIVNMSQHFTTLEE